MKNLITSVVLIGGILTSSAALSQKLSLDEYYSDYLQADNKQNTTSSYKRQSVDTTAEKLSLAQYYAEYCADNNTPTQRLQSTASTVKADAANTCENHYAEYLN